jgi:hypothetical protein
MSKIYYTESPCKDCTDRTVGCHSDCERYMTWKLSSSEKPRTYMSHTKRHKRNRRRRVYAEVD